MFKTEGQFEGTILETRLAEPRFNRNDNNAFDIGLKIQGPSIDGHPQVGWWSGEMSRNYGVGNFASKTQAEITMDNLRGIGFEGNDLTTLDAQLKGKKIPITVVARETKEGKTYYDIKYIGGGGWEPKPIDKSSIANRMAAIMGKPGVAAPAPAAAAAQGNSDEDSPW